MSTASGLLLIAGLGLSLGFPASASAAEVTAHFHLVPDVQNSTDCRGLNAVLARLHTVTVKNGDVELTSAGGIEGRMSKEPKGLYQIAFELEGRRVDAAADFAAKPITLTVTEHSRSCRWLAGAE